MMPLKHYGYYLFLGLGDFEAPPHLGSEWTSTWDLHMWRERIENLIRLGANTLFIYLMGHNLPYASHKFPEHIERMHPNVKRDFFQGVLDWCGQRGIEAIAVFSTTGHAKGYVSSHPELAIRGRDGRPQTQTGIMCHHKVEARRYCLQVIEECLGRYRGFAGVILHLRSFRSHASAQTVSENIRRPPGRGYWLPLTKRRGGFSCLPISVSSARRWSHMCAGCSPRHVS